ncbi:MAG: hypothetical protein ABIP55_13795, partial [Tepidisphaeraceae bacterium]
MRRSANGAAGQQKVVSMTLSQITPVPMSSALRRDWSVAVPGILVAAFVALPAFAFGWPYRWAFIVAAVAAAIAT